MFHETWIFSSILLVNVEANPHYYFMLFCPMHRFIIQKGINQNSFGNSYHQAGWVVDNNSWLTNKFRSINSHFHNIHYIYPASRAVIWIPAIPHYILINHSFIDWFVYRKPNTQWIRSTLCYNSCRSHIKSLVTRK